MRVDDAGGPLPDEKFSVALDDEGNEAACGDGGAFAQIGQFPDAVLTKGDAKFFYRANRALRLARRANQGAEFHQRLVQVER